MDTLAGQRFTEFADKIANAKTRKEFMLAGHWLIDEYRGFRFQTHADQVEEIINRLNKNEETDNANNQETNASV